ncbi:peptidoglycan-binding protein [Thermosyntropha sp.]|uniref:peptidoglycan-binding protein n=1 Tax=Thermosyntropha sp. TaxID=2740820 RepID=UPI0025F82EF2|nr:peptidoglycan-binding protein [Thermosyntropha sp.]MBO8159460.1 peptidoglycan-binding protein [Thermosyntropha sp.]
MLKKSLTTFIILSFLAVSLTLVIPNTAEAAQPVLKWGSVGETVKTLQQTLNSKGYWCGAVDGIFGKKTYNAVIKFQKDAGIKVDGIVGPQTWRALGKNSNTNYTQPSRGTARTLTVVATGYCPCYKCNYPFYGQPSYLGYPLRKGIVAVDPKVIPMGSRLYIPGYGEGIAADQGGAIKGNRIDLCFSTHQEALNWGIKTVTITVYP